MNISENIKQAGNALSNCSASFLDFIKNNPESLRRSQFNQVVEQRSFPGCHFQPWPVFIDKNTKSELQDASVQVFDLITKIPRRIFGYDILKMSQYYGISESDMELLLFGVDDNFLKNCLGRGDFIMTPSFGLKCIEYNIAGHLGGWEIDFMQPQYTQVPIISQFLSSHPVTVKESRFFATLFSHLAREGVTRLKDSFGNNKELNVAVGYPNLPSYERTNIDNHLQMLFRQELLKVDNRFTGNLLYCDLGRLESMHNGLMMDGKRIHVLLEMNHGTVPIKFMDQVRMQKLVLFNGPVTWLMTNKLNMALLSSHQDSELFSTQEREIIAKYIPWSRKLAPGATNYHGEKIVLEQFVFSHKDHLVLKPADGLGGDGVCLGSRVSQEHWQHQVEDALKQKNWLVQEYLESASYMFQQDDFGCSEHNTVWGLFVFGSTGYAGGFVRLLPVLDDSGVINVSQGAEKTIIIEVE
jgi:hypothetical protein